MIATLIYFAFRKTGRGDTKVCDAVDGAEAEPGGLDEGKGETAAQNHAAPSKGARAKAGI